jgi:23S rRNA pseudouridine2605 synthase
VRGLPRGRVPLERALSKLGILSRAEARRCILEGRVAVAGEVARDPNLPVVPERAALELDGVALAPPVFRCLMLNKPRGVVVTERDPEGRRTVFDLLRAAGESGRLVAVGRLDRATSGLLLLTNDTRLADWLTDPARAVPRTYLVTVRGEIAEADRARLEAGVASEGELLAAVRVAVRKGSRRETRLVVVLDEGRNREVRRLFGAVGHEVTRLRRVAFGGLELGDLAPGALRELDAAELRRAFGPTVPLGRGPLGAWHARC